MTKRLTASDFDVWTLTDRHGLNPQRRGPEVRFFCPECTRDDPDIRRSGRTASASLRKEGQPWKCHRASCDVSGNALDLARLLGEVDAVSAPTPLPLTRRKTTTARPARHGSGERLRDQWLKLLKARTAADVEWLARWCVSVRGWPADVAAAASGLDIVIVEPTRSVRGASPLVRAAVDVNRLLLIPILCHLGVVRSIARRWHLKGPPRRARGREDQPGRKSLSLTATLTGDPESWGRTWCYGDLPAAVEAACRGEPVYFVEGAPDWMALTGVLRVSNEPGVVIGFFNTSTSKRLTMAFVRALAERNTVAPRVVLIPDIDAKAGNPTGGPGMVAAGACIDVLRGRAGAHLVRLPLDDGQEKTDVSDFLARNGTDALLRALQQAAEVEPAPIPIHSVAEPLTQLVLQAIRLAVSTTTHGRQPLVIAQVAAGVGKSTIALKLAQTVCSGELRIPVAGRRPKGVAAEDWPPQSRSVVFATPSHDLAAEKLATFVDLLPALRATHLRGLLEHCDYRDNARSIFASVGRHGVCGPKNAAAEGGDRDPQRCPRADSGCLGADEPYAARGELTLVPHAMLPRPKADLHLIDESPALVETSTIDECELTTLFATKVGSKTRTWRKFSNPDAGDAARLLIDAVGPVARQHAAAVSAGDEEPYPRYVLSEELRRIVTTTRKLPALVELGFSKGAVKPPVPDPAAVRAGRHFRAQWPSRPAFDAMKVLAAEIAAGHAAGKVGEVDGANADDDSPSATLDAELLEGRAERAPRAGIKIETDGSWSLVVWRVKQLPKAPCVVLDATADFTEAEWKAAYPHRKVEVLRLPVQGTAPAAAVHFETKTMTRGRLLNADGSWQQGAEARVARMIRQVVKRTRELCGLGRTTHGLTVGVLTHSPLARALGNESSSADESELLELLRKELGARGVTLRVGYFGKHDRGTNEFEEVDALLVLGDPFGNCGDIASEAAFLELDPEALYRARTAATGVQAIARARHIRRDPHARVPLFFVGRTAPAIPGVAWTVKHLAAGREAGTEYLWLESLAIHVARVMGVICKKAIERFDATGTQWEGRSVADVPRRQMENAVKGAARQFKFVQRYVSTGAGRIKVYTRDDQVADAWAAGLRSDLNGAG